MYNYEDLMARRAQIDYRDAQIDTQISTSFPSYPGRPLMNAEQMEAFRRKLYRMPSKGQ